MAENTTIRNSFARDRTNMANERTLLAYLRTGLGFILTAAIILRFSQTLLTNMLSAVLLTGGVGFLIFGIFKFLKLKTVINNQRH